jgi:acetylornithine/succinyldiaminopimelate/putrescine aminotransferase
MNNDFLKYQAQTTPNPLGLEVARAAGSYIYDTSGKMYLDFVAGVSVCTLGHCHPKVVSAIQKQAASYMHVMVYGEYVQKPVLSYVKFLTSLLPSSLNNAYLVNSGTEAIEGAIKLARRATGRSQIIAARGAYHGNTMGSLSLSNFESRKAPFRPLIPNIAWIQFNEEDDIHKITTKTAAVVLETIQGGAGFILPKKDYLVKIKNRCQQVGALLILDEIQPGFGRTGKLFAYEHFDCIPDILVIGKGMASGLPIGAFVAAKELMYTLRNDPMLGHITTFGGNPVIAAAAMATLQEVTESNLINETLEKESLIRDRLKHKHIKEIRGKGLMLVLILKDQEYAKQLVLKCIEKGLILFWLLYEAKAVRITPPLTISSQEIEIGCNTILEVLDEI